MYWIKTSNGIVKASNLERWANGDDRATKRSNHPDLNDDQVVNGLQDGTIGDKVRDLQG